MKLTINHVEVMDTVAPAMHQVTDSLTPIITGTIHTFKDISVHSLLMNAMPSINIDKMSDTLIELGQHILLGASGVVVVACGILIAVGLKREGWKRVLSIIQGLGVGLVGPTIVTIVAGLFVGFSKMIT